MKQLRKLLYCLVASGALLFSGNAWSQISYYQDFEGDVDWSDTSGNYYLDMPFESCDGMVLVSFLWSEVIGVPLITSTPSVGISNGAQAVVSYDYKLSQFSNYTEALPNDPEWGNIRLEYATSESGPWTLIDDLTAEDHVVSTSCAMRQVAFTPPAGENIYIRFNVEVNSDSSVYIDGLVFFDNFTVTQGEVCETPAPDGLPAMQSVCSNANIGDLNIGDYNTILWYTAETGGIPLASNDAISNGSIYYAANLEECESTERVAVMVTVNTVEEPQAAIAQTFCSGATVGDLQVEDGETSVSWYAAETGGIPLIMSTALINDSTYYVSQTVNGCESADRTAVTVAITTAGAPQAAATQSFCTSATVSDLQVEGNEAVSWYTAETGGAPLEGTASLVTGSTYYAAHTVNGCESTRAAVTVTINATTEPDVDSPQVFTSATVVLYDIEAGATGAVKWYATEADAMAGENALPETTAITESGTYYVTQVILGCESEPVAVAIEITLATGNFEKNSIVFYPNPVKNILVLSAGAEIDSVAVYDLLGQQLIYKKMSPANDETVDMSLLSQGTYMVEVMTGSKRTTIKILKQ
jgi:hypothetical protein